MKKLKFTKLLSVLLCACMLMSTLAMPVLASGISLSLPSAQDLSIDNILTDETQNLAPDVTQREVVFYDANGVRQRMFIVTANLAGGNVSVETSYYNDQCQVAGMQKLTDQVAAAEKNHEGENYRVVAGINAAFYNTSTGWPGGAFAMNGVVAQDAGNQPFFAILKDGTAMIGKPADWAGVKAQVKEAIQGYELLVWEGEDVFNYNRPVTDQAMKTYPRTCVGVTADGQVIAVQADGNQAPNYGGMPLYEVSKMMIQLGCVAAVRLDEGGSSTYAAREEGTDEFKVLNSPLDGAERTISNGLIFVSTVAPTGVFDHAIISGEYDHYAPFTTSVFSAIGADAANQGAEIPADATWTLSDASFGTIENGKFVSNGKLGDVAIQMEYNGKVVGSKLIHIVNPDALSFGMEATVLPYGQELNLNISGQYGNYDMFVDAGSYEIVSSAAAAGTLQGNLFIAANDKTIASTELIATYKHAEGVAAKLTITFGEGSKTLYDFENGIDSWLGDDQWNKVAADYNQKPSTEWCDNLESDKSSYTFLATAENGQVKNGEYALGFTIDYTQNTGSGSWSYTHLINLDILNDKTLWRDVANGVNGCRIGMWMYIPENADVICPRILWSNSTDGEKWTRNHTKINMYNPATGKVVTGLAYDGLKPEVIPESGWNYIWVDIDSTDYAGYMTPDSLNANSSHSGNMYPAFMEFIIHSSNKNNEKVTFFIDDITLDFSDIVPDRFMPVISSPVASLTDGSNVAFGGTAVKTSTFIFSANVADDTTSSGVDNASGLDYTTAQIYVDGQPVPTTGAAGKIYTENMYLVDGVHDVTFTIADKAGNLQKLTKQITVEAGSECPGVSLIGRNESGATPMTGSLYYLDLKTSDITKIQSISTQIYLNGNSIFELDHIAVPEGFQVTASFNEKTLLATITVTRVGEVKATGEAILASIPVRVWDNTASIAPNNYPVINVDYDIKSGIIAYVDGVSVKDNQISGFGSAMLTVKTTVQGAGNLSTFHDHTAVAVEDLAPTCTADGYTGRTYCDVCKSIVAWGTTVEAKGHSYAINEGVLCCENGCGKTFTGIWEDGKTYVDGIVMADGWNADKNMYYVDGKFLTGMQVIDGLYYEFDASGITKGSYTGFIKDAAGTHYAVLGKLQIGWTADQEGNSYYFDKDTCMVTGEVKIEGLLYTFGEDGKLLIGGWSVTPGGTRYYWAGVMQRGFQVIDGKTYFFNYSDRYMMTGYVYARESAYGGDYSWYYLDENGVLICKLDNGLHFAGEDIVYYQNNMPIYAGLVQDENGDYYYINSSKKGVKDCRVWVTKTNGLLPADFYYFDVNGKLVENGLCIMSEKIIYLQNGEPIYKGLVADEFGDIYYVNSSKQAMTNGRYWVVRNNGLLPSDFYYIGADGKIIKNGTYVDENGNRFNIENYKINGLCYVDGNIQYYQNGTAIYAGLVKDDNGDIYYINSSKKAVVSGRYWVVRNNGLLPSDFYYIGADGKIVENGTYVDENGNRFSIKNFKINGLCYVDGDICFYENGTPIYAGLVKDENGDIYYINSSKKAVKDGKYWVTRNSGVLPSDFYWFDENGKMIQTGLVKDVDGSIYYLENLQKVKSRTVLVDGYYYYFTSSGHAVVGRGYGVYHPYTNGLILSGYYQFDEYGRMLNPVILKQGLVRDEDGELRYYVDGAAIYAGLIQDENGDYYYINSAKVAVKNGKFWVTKNNNLLPSATYTFDENGRLVF